MSAEERGESLHEWDGAYVLGALSPEDRSIFEEHLEGCASCPRAVAELAGIPALLARVPEPARTDRDEEEHKSPALAAPIGARSAAPELATLARRARRTRVRRRWVAAGTALLAAAAIVTAVLLPNRSDAPQAPTTSIALTQPAPGPLTATVDLTAQRWGTALSMTCHYASSNGPSGYAPASSRYALYVTDVSGTATRVASWSAWPGATIHASGAIDVPESQVRAVEVRDATSGAVLLSSPVK
jgi:hypothetical protein